MNILKVIIITVNAVKFVSVILLQLQWPQSSYQFGNYEVPLSLSLFLSLSLSLSLSVCMCAL